MLKAPVAGQVKTRLVPPLSPKDAARLYTCFILDTFHRMNTLPDIDIIAAFTPQKLAHRVRKVVPPQIPLIPQKGKDLGERLHNVFSRLFFVGYEKVAIIGSDSPDLPIEYIEKSFSLLNKKLLDGKKELVLGPSEDGGYYLIAMSNPLSRLGTDLKFVPKVGEGGFSGQTRTSFGSSAIGGGDENPPQSPFFKGGGLKFPSLAKRGKGRFEIFSGQIFQDIPWSTNKVLEETKRKAKNIGLELAILPKWYDIDDFNSLMSLMILRNNMKKELMTTNKLLKKIFKDIHAKTGKSGSWGIE